MIFVLDTNIVSYYLRGHEVVYRRWMQAEQPGNAIYLTPMAYYETKRGLLLPQFAKLAAAFEMFSESYPPLVLDLPTLDRAAYIHSDLKVRGLPLEDADILVAATALRHNATLVTHNVKHLARVPNIRLEDWTQ